MWRPFQNNRFENKHYHKRTPSHERQKNRRDVLKGIAGTAIVLAAKSYSQEQENNDTDSTSAQPENLLTSEEVERNASNQLAGLYELRQIAMNKPERLHEVFQLKASEIGSSEHFAVAYANKLEQALNAGCLPEDQLAYGKGFQAAMADTYNLAAVRGLFGFSPEETDDYIRSTEEYSSFSAARKAVLDNYQLATDAGIADPLVNLDLYKVEGSGDVNDPELQTTLHMSANGAYDGTGNFMGLFKIYGLVPLRIDTSQSSEIIRSRIGSNDDSLLGNLTTYLKTHSQ